MRTCPACGETVSPNATSCGVCSAAVPPGRPLSIYLSSAAALLAIIAAAALLHSYLQPRITRPPTDFLPAATRAVIALDVRPSSPGARLVGSNWSPDNIAALADRAQQLAQTMVDLTGLQLDLREDASRWFGGELLAASIGGVPPALGPRSLILISRVTDPRHARRDLDRAITELAREAGWRRMTVRSDTRAITVWGEPGGKSAVAYTVLDGCLLLSANDEVIEACLQSSTNPSDRLTETTEFTQTRAPLPGNPLLWAYVSTSDVFDAARYFLPEARRGWGELLRAYLGRKPVPRSPRKPPTSRSISTGALALALTPEKDGVRLHLSYRREGIGRTTAGADSSGELLKLLPREVAGYALIRDLHGLASLPAERPGQPVGAAAPFRPWALFPFFSFQPSDLPDSLLLAVMPGKTGGHHPRVAAALGGKGAVRTGLWLSKLIPNTQMYEAAGATVLTSRADVIKKLQEAATDPSKRLEVKTESGARLQAWARPGQLSPAFHGIGEIEIKLLDNPTGAQGAIYIKAEPRYLLGR